MMIKKFKLFIFILAFAFSIGLFSSCAAFSEIVKELDNTENNNRNNTNDDTNNDNTTRDPNQRGKRR